MWTQTDIDEWQAELKPLGVQKVRSLQEAFAYFKEHTVCSPVICPLGYQLAIERRHFFSLTCQKRPGCKGKGWVTGATDTEHALQMIELGEVGYSDLSGCDPVRLQHLPLFVDVLASPHVIGQKLSDAGTKLVYVKRYASAPDKPRAMVAVVHLLASKLVPASFHPKALSVNWLNTNLVDVIYG